ncbi:hypothetical protein GGF32_007768 [Allomyces javanicus]|nr:hypothetical protein GGF32_007768 [Allomyces javanicus]
MAGTVLKSCALFTALFIAALAVVAALYWPAIQRTHELWFPTRVAKNLDQCTYLDKNLFGCEDIVVHGKYAYLACADQQARTGFWPPLGFLDKSTDTTMKDQVLVYDFEEQTLTPLVVRGYNGDFSLHGLSVIDHHVKKNKVTLHLVNHKRSGSCIDIFDHRVGTNELLYGETVCDPLIRSPDAIIPLTRNSFYITNYLSIGPNVTKMDIVLDMALARPTSDLVFRTEDGQIKMVRNGIKGANGLALTADKDQLWMTESLSGELWIFDIQADGSLRESEKRITLSFFPDNVHMVPETGAMVVSGPGGMLNAARADGYQFRYQPDANPPSSKTASKGSSPKPAPAASKKKDALPLGPGVPSVVAIVTNATSHHDQFYGKKYVPREVFVDPKGNYLFAASVAAVHWPSQTVLLGGPMMKGVVKCPWPAGVEKAPVAGGKKVAAEKNEL